jgi:uncharacterized protein (DUF433 family)
MKSNLKNRIEINPKKLAGKPVIFGTRVSVEQILALLASGHSFGEITTDFPQLESKDIFAAIDYATHIVHESVAYPKAYVRQIRV